MAKFGNVCSIDFLRMCEEEGVFGDYHLLLAHDVVDRKADYAQMFSHDYGFDDNFVIMDNSVIELGQSVTYDFMAEACEAVGANVFVLPDELMDRDGTRKAILKALDEWDGLMDDYIEPMAVPQGKDPVEWLESLKDIAKLSEITWIGIPKNYQEKFGSSRQRAVELVQEHAPHCNIHLLGMTKSICDDLAAARMHGVKGIDSNFPIRLGQRERATIGRHSNMDYARGDWWDVGDAEDLTIEARYNVAAMMEWVDPKNAI